MVTRENRCVTHAYRGFPRYRQALEHQKLYIYVHIHTTDRLGVREPPEPATLACGAPLLLQCNRRIAITAVQTATRSSTNSITYVARLLSQMRQAARASWRTGEQNPLFEYMYTRDVTACVFVQLIVGYVSRFTMRCASVYTRQCSCRLLLLS
jgi:hypothetical protein